MLAVAPKRECSLESNNLEHEHRLTTMGELAAGLAHEIQQRLTVIANYANGCVHRLENDRITPDEMIVLMKQIADTAMQANDITRRARNFSKKQTPELEVLDLHELLTNGVELVRVQAEEHGIEISLQLQAESPLVVADQTQISQVIMNLLLNAIEALADPEHSGERRLCVETATNGDEFLHAKIIDTGLGIPAEIQFMVFEPFYTTKPNGLGIGLGLCRSIIEQHLGNMTLESEVGTATRIGFSLPRARI